MPVRPTLVIGLGGTGRWVLTYLKELLLQTYEGRVPSNVRLLCFDLEKPAPSTRQQIVSETYRVKDVFLSVDDREIVGIGGDFYDLYLKLKGAKTKKDYPYLDWFVAEDYEGLAEGDFNTSVGGGKRRPFGRMALFLDLMQNAQVISEIKFAIQQVSEGFKQDFLAPGQFNPQSYIDVYIVGSLAGGTGSGLIMDIALLTRAIINRYYYNRSFKLRGYIALPTAFATQAGEEEEKMDLEKRREEVEGLYIRSFGFLRELDRWMITQQMGVKVDFGASHLKHDFTQWVYDARLFETCFLFDSNRPRNSLDRVKLEYGLYPAMADSLFLHMDQFSGQARVSAQVNADNDAGSKMQHENVSHHFSIGTYSYIYPVEDIIRRLSFRFILEVLRDKYFKLKYDEKTDSFIFDPQQIDNNVVSSQVQLFLANPPGAQDISPVTKNLMHWRQTNLNRNEDVWNAIEAIADTVLNLQFTHIPPERRAEVQEVQDVLGWKLRDTQKTSAQFGDTYNEAASRIPKNVAEDMDTYFGRANPEKGNIREGGKFQRAFGFFATELAALFNNSVKQYVLSLLNDASNPNSLEPDGTNRDPSAGLGFAIRFSEELLKLYIEPFLRLLEHATDFKEMKERQAEAQEKVNKLRKEMELKCARAGGLMSFFANRKALQSQEDYLRACHDLVILMKLESFLKELEIGFRAIRAFVRDVLVKELHEWEDRLIRDMTRGVKKIYDDYVNYRSIEKQMSRVREYLTDDHWEEEQYRAYASPHFRDLIVQFGWVATETGLYDFQIDLTPWGLHRIVFQTPYQEEPADKAVEGMADAVAEYFKDLRRFQVVNLLAKKFNNDGTACFNYTEAKADPMINGKNITKSQRLFAVNTQGLSPEIEQAFIADQTLRDGTMKKGLRSLVQDLGNFSDLTAFTNPNVATFFVTTNSFSLKDVGVLETCWRHYGPLLKFAQAEEVRRARLAKLRGAHIYSEEQGALQYELKLEPLLGEEAEIFHPDTTIVLSDPQWFKNFTLSWAYGFFEQKREVDADGNEVSYVVFKLNSASGVQEFRMTGSNERAAVDDLHRYYRQFLLFNCDVDDHKRRFDKKSVTEVVLDHEKNNFSGKVADHKNLLQEKFDALMKLRGQSGTPLVLKDLCRAMAIVVKERLQELK
jgi:hypothetical protein